MSDKEVITNRFISNECQQCKEWVHGCINHRCPIYRDHKKAKEKKMANDINQVSLVGRLTKESEMKYTNSGLAVCKFSLAVNRKKKSGDQWTDEVSYFDIVLWGKQGEAIQQYLGKGKQIAVSGELRQNRWEQDGQKRSKIEVVASNIQLLGGGEGQKSGTIYNDDIPY